jgi:hypothetical protein
MTPSSVVHVFGSSGVRIYVIKLTPGSGQPSFQGGLGVGLKVLAGGSIKTQDTTQASDTATAAVRAVQV